MIAGSILCYFGANVGVVSLLAFVLLLFLGCCCGKTEEQCKETRKHIKQDSYIDSVTLFPMVADINEAEQGIPWYEITLLDESKIITRLRDMKD